MSGIDLVTGGSGYFGSVLVHHLLRAGVRVRVLDLEEFHEPPEGLEVVRADVRDAQAVARACRGVRVVHHNVAQVPLAKDRRLFWSVNRDGTRNVLRASADAGVRKVVYTSSSAVFGVPDHNPVTEETPPRPGEAYGRSKLAGEALCREFAAGGLDVTIVRPRTILGHGRLGIMQVLFEWVRRGAAVPVLGRGDNVYQFVHADDLADACLRAAERPGSDLFHIGAERFGTMREALEALVRHAATGSRVVSVPAWPAERLMALSGRLGLSPLGPYHALMYGRSLYFDVRKAKERLGWSARHGNEEMLCASYDWYLEHRDALPAYARGRHTSPVSEGVLRLVRHALRFAPDR